MQIVFHNYHNHCVFSLSATMVTTLRLKQPTCFCSAAPLTASVPYKKLGMQGPVNKASAILHLKSARSECDIRDIAYLD